MLFALMFAIFLMGVYLIVSSFETYWKYNAAGDSRSILRFSSY